MKQLVSHLPNFSFPKLPSLPRRSGGAHSSLRVISMRARAPRLLLGTLVLILCIAGVRNIFGGSRATEAAPVARPARYDVGAASFAQSFASAYLTWGPTIPEQQRTTALKPFLAQGLEADAGLAPSSKSTETVNSTQVAEESRAGAITDVLVVAETSSGTQYLSVPVTRDERGLLSVISYPAMVGPPATDVTISAPNLSPVEDQGLETVVSRGLRNYLTGEAANLRADLTGEAVVSLPSQPLTVEDIESVSWFVPGRIVAVQVDAEDRQGAELTLTYQVGVVRKDRWYIDSIQVDPTLKGGL
jgi:hypothetical protein